MCIYIYIHTHISACHPLRRGHANLLCIVPIVTDDPRRESQNIPDVLFSVELLICVVV